MPGLRRIARALACGLLLASCAGQGGGSSSDSPLVISRQVDAHLQKYLGEVSAGRAGAFAVTENGANAYYTVCESGGCHGQYNFSTEALKGCRKYGRGPCLILASNSTIKRRYTVSE